MSKVSRETGFVEFDDIRLYFEVAGEGDPVVLVHRRWGDRRHWDAQFNALADGHQVVRYDVRGFGRSSMPEEDVEFRHEEDLCEVFEEDKEFKRGSCNVRKMGF